MKSNTTILKFLKDQGKAIDLPLDVLRQFQEFEKTMVKTLKSYDEEMPPFAAYAMKCFTKIEMFCAALIHEKYPSVLQCHEEVMAMFGGDEAFADGITVPTWIYFNFPVNTDGEPVAALALRELPVELAEDITPFVCEMVKSRLGLYEVINDKKDTCHLKELFTDSEIILSQSLGGTPKGSIALLRTFTLAGKTYIFGNSIDWPADKKEAIQNMVEDKMDLYFENDDLIKSYETMMRLAGPYWFSITAKNYEGDILSPDFYLEFYE